MGINGAINKIQLKYKSWSESVANAAINQKNKHPGNKIKIESAK